MAQNQDDQVAAGFLERGIAADMARKAHCVGQCLLSRGKADIKPTRGNVRF
jgi:hypothetical protein